MTENDSNTDWARLFGRYVSQVFLGNLIETALAEDLGPRGVDGDLSTALLGDAGSAAAMFRSRREGVLCGAAVLGPIATRVDPALKLNLVRQDGQPLERDEAFGSIDGPVRSILAVERTMLNFLGRLSGIATLTDRYVQAVHGTGAEIYDTRKTTPGWRGLEKYAVRCGGGHSHRMGLYDAILIKDNHLRGIELKDLGPRLAEVRRETEAAFVEVEVDTLEQLEVVLGFEVDVVLLDNMDLGQLAEAVSMRNDRATDVKLEASGGVDLQSVRAVAETGVDRIAVGALTHSAPALDVGLDLA